MFFLEKMAKLTYTVNRQKLTGQKKTLATVHIKIRRQSDIMEVRFLLNILEES